MSPSAREDYLLRLIAEIFRVLARIAGLMRAGKPEEALEEIHAAYGMLLGPLAEVAPRLDSASAAQIVGNPDQILAWARLLHAEAEVWRLRGDAPRAGALEARALELALEAQARQPSDPSAAERLVSSLAQSVPAANLTGRHRAMLPAVHGTDPRA